MSLKEKIFEKVRDNKKSLRIFKEQISAGKSITDVAKYFNVKPNITMLKEQSKKELKAANEIINEAYSKLSLIEKEYVSLVNSNNKRRIYNQVKITEALISGLKDNKEKQLATECLTVLKKDILKRPLTEAAERTLDLKHTIATLLEADEYYGGMLLQKLGNLKHLKDVKIAVLSEDKDEPETLYITFSIVFYPLGNDFSSVRASLMDLDKKFRAMGRKILNQTIRNKQSGVFTGEGIWDGSVNIHNTKAGAPVEANGELTLHVNKGSVKSLDDAKRALTPSLKELDSLIPSWFPEVDKVAQKQFLKNPNQGDQGRLDTLKRTYGRLSEPQGKDEFGGTY